MPLSRIEFVNIHSPEDFYAQLEGQLDLDYELGHSLDAVFDVLSTEVAGPVEIIWHDSDFSRTALGDWYLRILDVLNTVDSERSDLSLSLK